MTSDRTYIYKIRSTWPLSDETRDMLSDRIREFLEFRCKNIEFLIDQSEEILP